MLKGHLKKMTIDVNNKQHEKYAHQIRIDACHCYSGCMAPEHLMPKLFPGGVECCRCKLKPVFSVREFIL